LIRAYLEDLQKFGIKLGLDNIRTLCAAFGDPQKAFPSVHVAGTNGKGSVCAMLTGILARAGYRVGLYTSPHLVRIEERIRVDGRTIPGGDFDRLLKALKERIEGLLAAGTLGSPPTYFEVVTALAFLYFREKQVDLAVLETGMGGRFDATNIVTPLVSVITSISRDHPEHLGGTISKIAFEKAGIIKPHVPVVCGARNRTAYRVIKDRALAEEAPLVRVFDQDGSLIVRKGRGRRRRFEYRLGDEVFRFSPRLAGVHQGENAAVAIAAVRALGRVWKPIGPESVIRGIEEARWEGRLEAVGRRPLVLLDGAHNEAGLKALRAYIEDSVPRPVVVVFAMMKDKAVGRAARILFPVARKVVVTSLPFERAASPGEIQSRAREFRKKIVIEPDPGKALALARKLAGPRGTVVVTGSLYLVGEIMKIKSVRA